MSDLQELKDALNLHDAIIRHVPDDKEWADHVKPIVEAARRVANGVEVRYCLWHERRAWDDSGDEDSGAIVTRFCSSQDGSHDCDVETRLLLGTTKDE